MRTEKLTDVRNRLSQYVEQVRHGERIRILVRGVPAADLVPVAAGAAADADLDAHLDDLTRRGLIRRGRAGVPDDLLAPGPRAGGRPLSEYVTDERRSGR